MTSLKKAIVAVLFLLVCSSGAWSQSAMSPALHRGINLSSWFANAPRQILNERDFRQIKELGFDFVRLPVNPELVGYQFDDQRQLQKLDLRNVDRAIEGLTRNGLTVILDIHPESEFMERLEQGGVAEDQFVRLWQKLSAHYQNYGESQLVYELLNEPQYYGKTVRYNALMWRLVTALRVLEPKRLLVINTPGVTSLSPVDALNAVTVLNDAKIIYDTHFYQPYLISHQGIPSAFPKSQIHYLNKLTYPSSQVDRAAVRRALDPAANTGKAMDEVQTYINENWNYERIESYLSPVAQWAKQNHTRVLVLEFGVYRPHSDPASRYRWIGDVRQALDKLELGWAYWDYSDGFGIVQFSGNTAIDPDGAVKFTDVASPKNMRIVEPESIKALGLTYSPSITPAFSSPRN